MVLLIKAYPTLPSRGNFLIGAVASVTSALCVVQAAAFAATDTTRRTAIPELLATIADATAAQPRDTWWTLYTTNNPDIQPYPGCFFAQLVRNAEAGDQTSIAQLSETE